ncbi:Sugar kinase of the NBD/HSP70 family, may contain an N-terminal HTH domain [Microbacterium sp. cf046]|uniref:ROK family protein n=1 Tax=Microbacterium sp. cf046 TaxID=1761803 RepID=UPI0008E303A0|nr:ROK family protein [Microbacterium sp. cf046]SFR89851.1 Sugar kinase of the NBD/HSP70 family, may contain an N-terminal HTH domain [Microbacterium sp. cf046]
MTDVISGTPPNPLRRASLAAVLNHAWDAADFTASDAMAGVGLTRSTTIDVIDELVHRGLLRELPNARAAGDYHKGRPSRRFELRADAGAVVGIDVGRGHLITTVADLRGRTLVRQHIDLDPENDGGDVRRALAERALDAALTTAGRSRADAIALCVGVPAPVNAAGESPPHRDGFWRRMNPGFADGFAAPIPLVRVENDAYLAAMAERTSGAAVGFDDFVVLLAGERLGAGIAVDGRILRGAHGGVAEMVAFDHVVGVGGAWGLGFRAAQWAREAIAAGDIPADHRLARHAPAEIDGRLVLELAAAGDADALRVTQRVGESLAVITGVFGSLFDPRRLIVSGAVSGGIEPVIDAARRALPDELDLPIPEIHASPLGADVVSIGAVAAAVETARAGILDLTNAERAAG